MQIWTINNKNEEKFLRKRAADFDFTKFSKKEVGEMVRNMKETMIAAPGVGLSANQVGLDLRMFVAKIPISRVHADRNESAEQHAEHKSDADKAQTKFYAIFNPEIIKFYGEKIVAEEGCLSVPETYGFVERSEKIILTGNDRYGKKLKMKVDGFLARVFQHEIDHLNGTLFIDKAKEIHKVTTDNKQLTTDDKQQAAE